MSGELAALREQALACKACPLWRGATQTVFGEGPRRATIVLVGEQPGDSEDRQGRPFVGPAGRVLDRALAAAQIERGSVYATNAVKHFKYRERGKRRIHQRPSVGEIFSPVIVTAHPSSVLRKRDSEAREAGLRLIGEDLGAAARIAAGEGTAAGGSS